MREILTNKENLFKFGYCVIRNFLDDKEIKRAKSTIEKMHKLNGKERNIVLDIYNYKEAWEFITNNRLLNVIRSLLGQNIFYLHSCATRSENQKDMTDYSWHRDNPCRLFGKGPDWDKDEPYNVLSVLIYLSHNENTNSGINVIPFTNQRRYTLSNILRLFHYKTKYISFFNYIFIFHIHG